MLRYATCGGFPLLTRCGGRKPRLRASNAVVFSPSGTPEAEFCVGDQIPDTDTDGVGVPAFDLPAAG
ncbi:hypothetical protein D7231_02800 [Streptomyces klenkii]|uniref:Uncharacterized protein n=1 Tax=Streptomyces klenkii TaxID=1420899 RepID=A0A3B0BZG8_9ACTN|nr:hypothetical protein D7231_02800 [Streptomyces klenkii]